jgi:hypothetical protein
MTLYKAALGLLLLVRAMHLSVSAFLALVDNRLVS